MMTEKPYIGFARIVTTIALATSTFSCNSIRGSREENQALNRPILITDPPPSPIPTRTLHPSATETLATTPDIIIHPELVRKIKFMESGLRLPFGSIDDRNLYLLIPDWFYSKILENLDLRCDANCKSGLNRVSPSSSDQRIIINDDYFPDLISINLNIPDVVTRQPDAQIRQDAITYLRGFVNEMTSLGYTVNVRSAYRGAKEQEYLHSKDPYSAELPHYSQHQSGLAVDLGFTLKPGYTSISDRELRDIMHKYGIVHPYNWDPPHYFILDAIYPGLTGIMMENGIDPDSLENINSVQLGIAQAYEYQVIFSR